MDLRTLILTPWMQPHGIVSWQAAIVLQVDGKVDVLDVYKAQVASAGNKYEGRAPIVFDVPAVVRLQRPVHLHRDGVKFSRSNIYQRDGYRCCYCNKRFLPALLTYDHVVPRAQGGKTTWENVVSACRPCNGRKDNRTPYQAGMKQHYVPFRPHSLGSRTMIVDLARAPEQWHPYLVQQAATA